MATERFNAPDDEAAIERARKLFNADLGKGYELWQGERHFLSEARDALTIDQMNLDLTLPLGFIPTKSPN